MRLHQLRSRTRACSQNLCLNPGLLLVRSGPPQSTSRPGSHLHIVLVTVGQDAGGELGTVDVGLDPRVLLAWNKGRAL